MAEMSAVHLHNTLYNQELADSRSNFPHSRNLSIISSVTVQTNTTLHSQPHEPLLPQNGAPRESYHDILSRNTKPKLSTDNGHSAENKTLVEPEPKNPFATFRRRPLTGMRRLKIGLDVVLGVWALYTSVRYFLAFTKYESISGETVALVLGTCSGLSFAFLICALALFAFRPRLLRYGISYGSISTLYWCLTYIALLLLFAPAAVNFAFVFVWRNTSDLQLSPKHRCSVDVDLVWAKTTHRLCKTNSAAWGVWVTLSSLRLAITSAVLLGYQFVLYKLSQGPDMLAHRFRGKHRINPSDLYSYHSALPPTQSAGVPFPPGPSSMLQSETRLQSQSSLSSRTKLSTTHRQMSRSRSSGLSGTGDGVAAASMSPPLPSVPERDDAAGFSERFNAMVSEIERETEAALRIARSEETGSMNTDDSSIMEEEEYVRRQLRSDEGEDSDDGEDDFYAATRTMTMPAPVMGYNEFGLPYPPDQDVPMMNGYIRRMPTIESMGSREIGSSIAASSLPPSPLGVEFDRRASHSMSRPGTRNAARASWGARSDISMGTGGSARSEAPSSRANSLSYQVEKIAAQGFLGAPGAPSSNGHSTATHWANEMGEWVEGMVSVRRVVPSSPSDEAGMPVMPPGLHVPGRENGYEDSTGGSRSTNAASFVTAASGASVRSRGEGLGRPATPERARVVGSDVPPPTPPKDV